ncbi:radical SAM domain protein [Methanosalsum zhilinae DSM 4017]|uniref:Radical SAM domain protein n=1 Tax=Methanosalsum zhilinae (strain DSM 4017 / NBRC 107636 / OCM 62 / WeN5) TaxID=679901 RepID=F7XP20_METZD|nr:DUF5714 domain-containing protein [Methanosalsum zhilinae]AEH60215.1 radical SAM domain protein [Methanosalsum zhilinae DSM 4017]
MINSSTRPKQKSDCMVCGKDIEYLNQAVTARCHYCREEKETYLLCEKEHYVCNECHSRDAVEIIETFCLKTDLEDPFEIAETLMRHPEIPMHGPEHHALVPAVLIAAYQNHTGKKNEFTILEGIKRGRTIPGGYCGFYGACGAGIGTGVAVSVLTGATPLLPQERSHSLRATSRSLDMIADAGGPRCCKKAVRVALEEGVAYISEIFGLDWDQELEVSIRCDYYRYNKECDVKCKYKK